MKRKISLVTTLAMVLTLVLLFTACAGTSTPGTSETPSPKPQVTDKVVEEAKLMRYYMPGAATPQADVVTEAINQKLAADGVPVIFTPMYVPWDQWVNKTNIMLSTGEEFELLHIMEDYVPTSTYVARNGLFDLKDLIDEYAPDMWNRFDQVLWDSATVDGKIYTVPDFWRDNSGDGEGLVNIRKDKLDKYGLVPPKSLEEMLETLPILQQKWAEEDGKKRYVYEHSINRAPVMLHRSYDSWPFYASQDGIFMVRQDGNAQMYFTSDEFKQDADFFNKLYTGGLIHPDILNLPADTRKQDLENGDYLMGVMTGPNTSSLLINGVEGAEVSLYHLNEDKPYLCNLPLLNSNAIPSTAKNPELGLLFLDWMYSSKENQDLVLYGVEGVHWNPEGEDQFSRIKGDDDKPLYAFDSWMIEYVPYHRFDVEDISSEQEKLDYTTNIYEDNTVYSPMVGFNFNSEPVKVEYANVIAEYTTSMLPIKVGVIAYEDGYESAIQKMKVAGYETVIAEYQKQLKAYTDSKK